MSNIIDASSRFEKKEKVTVEQNTPVQQYTSQKTVVTNDVINTTGLTPFKWLQMNNKTCYVTMNQDNLPYPFPPDDNNPSPLFVA